MGAATRSAKRDAEEAGLNDSGPEPHTANKFSYEQLIGTDLRHELKHRGLPLSGNKSVLIRRLVENDLEEFNDFPENYPEVGTTTIQINDANVRTFEPHIRSFRKEGISSAPTRSSTRKTQVMPTADMIAKSSIKLSKGFPESSNAKAMGADIYKFMSVSELRQELGKKGMKKGGTKSQLLHRLTHGEDEPFLAQEEALAFDDQIDEDERRRAALMNPMEPVKKLVKPKIVKEPKPVKTGWYALNGDALKEECRSRDLSVTGRKQDLIDALEEDDRDRAAFEAEQALPGWKERIDENAIATGEKRLGTFVPRPSGRYRGRVRKAVSTDIWLWIDWLADLFSNRKECSSLIEKGTLISKVSLLRYSKWLGVRDMYTMSQSDKSLIVHAQIFATTRRHSASIWFIACISYSKYPMN